MSEIASKELCKNPLVSVSIITYNHKDYIAEAIESVLKQKVNFEYEIIIGDDFSNDGTQEIIKAYQRKYPDKIQLILHPRDYDCIPGRINNITNLYACRGKYTAMLDGDDLWLSEDKLQTQVDFLEDHDDFVLSFHETLLRYDDGKEVLFSEDLCYFNKTVFNHEDVTEAWFIQTSSIVFRNKLFGEFPEWFWEVYSADYAIQLLVSRYGKVKYFPELLSVRNHHSQSFSATQNTTWAHLKRRESEKKIFSQNFPTYEVYKKYSSAVFKLKGAHENLKKFRPAAFFLELSKFMVYSTSFATSRQLSTTTKIRFLKRNFLHSLRSRPSKE